MKIGHFRRLPKAMAFLILNHLDAWGSTFIIATLALVLHDVLERQTLLLVAALTVGYWLAFALNDFYDAPFDAADTRKARRNFFVRYPLKERHVIAALLLLTLFLFIAFASFGWRGWLAIAVSLFIMWAYSAPPLRFKSRPGLDLLIHAIFVETFPYLICLFLTGVTWTMLDVVLLLILFLSSLCAQLEQQLRDFHVDASTGRTFATTVGRHNAARLLRLTTALLMTIAALYTLNGTIPLFVAAFGLIGLPALLHRFLRGRGKPRSEKLIYYSALTGLLYVGFILIFYAARS